MRMSPLRPSSVCRSSYRVSLTRGNKASNATFFSHYPWIKTNIFMCILCFERDNFVCSESLIYLVSSSCIREYRRAWWYRYLPNENLDSFSLDSSSRFASPAASPSRVRSLPFRYCDNAIGDSRSFLPPVEVAFYPTYQPAWNNFTPGYRARRVDARKVSRISASFGMYISSENDYRLALSLPFSLFLSRRPIRARYRAGFLFFPLSFFFSADVNRETWNGCRETRR